jgi:hypothetical protein
MKHRMAHVQIRRPGGQWHEVRGTAMKLAGQNRYRITVTEVDPSLLHGGLDELEVHVNGLEARELRWVIPPTESAARGYVSFEASLDTNDHP